MRILARVAVLVMAGVFMLNVALAYIPPFSSVRAGRASSGTGAGAGTGLQPVPAPAPTPAPQGGQGSGVAGGGEPEPAKAKEIPSPENELAAYLPGSWNVVRFLSVSNFRAVRRGGEVIVEMTLQLDAYEGQSVWVWRVGVDARQTALVTDDGTWHLVRKVDGVSLVRDGVAVTRGPLYPLGTPRRVRVVFGDPGVQEVLLHVGWVVQENPDYEGWRAPVAQKVRLTLGGGKGGKGS
jgi:hypothetical protein